MNFLRALRLGWRGFNDPAMWDHLNGVRGLRKRLEEVVDAYRTVFESLAASVPRVPRELHDEHAANLRALGREISARTPGEMRQSLERELRRYARLMEEHLRRDEKEVREILAQLAVIAAAMATREPRFQVRFRGLSKKVRWLATNRKLPEIRRRLADEIRQLEQYAGTSVRDSAEALSRMQEDLHALRRKLEENLPRPAPRVESLDLDRAETAWPEPAEPEFSLALIVVEDADELRERHGPAAMEAVLREITVRLKEAFQEPDALCRCSDLEFLAIAHCDLLTLKSREGKLRHRLTDIYQVLVDGKPLSIPVRCGFEFGDYVAGESLDQMRQRLEDRMRMSRSSPSVVLAPAEP